MLECDAPGFNPLWKAMQLREREEGGREKERGSWKRERERDVE